MTALIPFFPNLGIQRGRRAAAVMLWTSFAGYVALQAFGGDGNAVGAAGAALLLLGYVCYFALARALGVARCEGARELDERERMNRDRAHYVAYQVLGWAMLAVVLYAAVAVRVDWLWMPTTPQGAVGALAAVAIALGLLPMTILAWTEPDLMADEGEEAPHVPFSPRLPMKRGLRMAMAALAVTTAAAALLAWQGVGPVPAEHADTAAGMATGMVVALLVLTRSAGQRQSQ